jgi:hypothetical protein
MEKPCQSGGLCRCCGFEFPSVLLFPLEPLWLKLALMGVSLVPLIGTAYYSRQYSIFKAGAQEKNKPLTR